MNAQVTGFSEVEELEHFDFTWVSNMRVVPSADFDGGNSPKALWPIEERIKKRHIPVEELEVAVDSVFNLDFHKEDNTASWARCDTIWLGKIFPMRGRASAILKPRAWQVFNALSAKAIADRRLRFLFVTKASTLRASCSALRKCEARNPFEEFDMAQITQGFQPESPARARSSV